MAQKLWAYLDTATPVPGPPGLPRVIHDEGVPLPVRTVIDMVGAGVTATDDEAGDRTIITIPGGTADMVVSVFGRPGPVITAQAGDYSAAQVTNAVSVLGSYSDPAWITSLAWGKIEGEPASFPPSPHTHDWGEISGEPSSFPPSAHTHDWADITGEPATFPPSAHTHPWTEVTSKPLTFPPEAHQHPWSDLTGVPSNVSNAVPNTTQVIAGTGLTGGGDLSGNVTLTLNKAYAQTPWVSNIDGAGYSLSALKQLTIAAGNVAGADAVTGIFLNRGYGEVGDSMDITWGPGPNRLGRFALSLWGGGESAFIFHAQTAGGDGGNNEIFRIQGNKRIYATAEVDIKGWGDGEGGDLRLCDVDGTPNWAMDVDSGNNLRIHRLGTIILRITPAFAIQQYLGGSLKTLSVDGSGFVKAT